MDDRTASDAPVHLSKADAEHARRLLRDTEGVRRAARVDQQGLAIPLLVLGPLTIGAAAAQQVWQKVTLPDQTAEESTMHGPLQLSLTDLLDRYWGTVGALGLIVIGAWFALRSRRRGMGAGAGAWIAGAVGVFILLGWSAVLFVLPLPLIVVTVLAPSGVIALALLLIAWRRHNVRLALWVVVFGLVTTLAGLGFFTNRVYDLLTLVAEPDGALNATAGQSDTAALVVLGATMLVVGWRAVNADRSYRTDLPSRRLAEPAP